MSNQLGFEPDELNAEQLQALNKLLPEAQVLSAKECYERAAGHFKETAEQARTKPLINVKLAQAILDVVDIVVRDFDSIPSHAKAWLKAAILYFAQIEDGENDFESLLGFEDDCEILNGCLLYAGRKDLVIAPEDYD